MNKRRVVITGLGTVNPIGNSVQESWQAAREGKCGIGPITQFDASEFKIKVAAEVKGFNAEAVCGKGAAAWHALRSWLWPLPRRPWPTAA